LFWGQGLRAAAPGDPIGYSTWIRTTDGAPPVQLGPHQPMAVSEDGKWVMAKSFPEAGSISVWLYPVGAGESRKLLDIPKGGDVGGSFTPAGKFVVSQAGQVYLLDPDAPSLQPIEKPDAKLDCSGLSRDG